MHRIPTALLSVLLLVSAPVSSRVAELQISQRTTIAGGQAFGASGPYELIAGRVTYELDPQNDANAAIVDLARAPRNGRGQVEAVGDLVVLRPLDPEKGSGTALVEVSNRGRKAALAYFNGASGGADLSRLEALGDGFLMRRGLTLIWAGWQFDVPPEPGRLRLQVPRASGLEGWVRSDWTLDQKRRRLELGHRGHLPYRPLDPESGIHRLTERLGRLQPRQDLPRASWRFSSDLEGIERDDAFPPGRIYELVYRSRDPAIVGMGLAAIRDILSYARFDPTSPFAVQRGFAFGVSQTGRFLRHFLYQGFNRDEQGRKVFDGMLIHTAGAGRGSFNHRFGQPSRDAHRYSAFFYPTDIFPFSSRPQEDPLTGRREGLLDRARDKGQLPRIIYSNTGYEYWGRAASLLHTSLDALEDLAPLPGVRIYHLAGCQHFPVGLGALSRRRTTGPRQYRGNPIDFMVIGRALVAAMQGWIEDDLPPPPGAYPRLDRSTLVPVAGLGFPRLPGLSPPGAIHQAHRVDYGPRFLTAGIIDRQPPDTGPSFPGLVPQVDADGNELGGVRPIELQVPLATYAPWHVRRGLPGGNGELEDFWGSFAPFPRSAAEAEASRDPRTPLDARYGSRHEFLTRVEQAAAGSMGQGFLLQEDLPRVMARAASLWDWIHRD